MKTNETNALEKALMIRTKENRTFGCPEVTIGWYGRKRVDFMEVNTKGIIRCYEIKVTKSDFHSKHGHNFCGHYNYYVMPLELYKQVKDEIPSEIGVLCDVSLDNVKSAHKCKLLPKEEKNMVLYLTRSMSRELKKTFDSKRREVLAYWKRVAHRNEESLKSANKDLRSIRRELTNTRRKYGKKL